MNTALTLAVRKKYRQLHDIYRERAKIFVQMGNYRGAIADYTVALETVGERERPFLYQERGEIYKRLGETARADEDFRLSIGQH